MHKKAEVYLKYNIGQTLNKKMINKIKLTMINQIQAKSDEFAFLDLPWYNIN